jgi:hypothetical protein
VVRQARLIAVVAGVLLVGCAVLLVAGCSGGRSEAPQKEEQGHTHGASSNVDRCWPGTRTFERGRGRPYTTNDVPGCPNDGLLEGTDERDKLAGEAGEDEVRGLGGADDLWGGFGRDVMHGGASGDFLRGSTVDEDGHDQGDDVLRGGPGRDSLNGFGGDDVIYGGDGDDVGRLWGGAGARTSFAAGMATISLTGPSTAGTGTSSIAEKAGTTTPPTRTTSCRAIAR